METETKGESKDDPISDGTSLLVNQSGTGVQKRQKKSTAPVLQRIRPISKRKVSDFAINYLIIEN